MPTIGQRIASAYKAFRFSGYGGGMGGNDNWAMWNRVLPQSQYDYKRESGNLWENSVVYALLSWQANQFAQAPLVVQEETEREDEYQTIRNHPMAQLIKRPNEYWSRRDLWGATLLSLNVGGNAYWIKVRSGASKTVQLWWVPHWMMFPIWPSDGSEYIAKYKYRVEGKDFFYKPSEVVHFRNNIINPLNQRIGLGSWSASLREICTENEAATYEAAMLRNRGIPGVILSPKQEVAGITPEKAQSVKTLYKEEFGGDGAGNVMLSSLPLDVAIPQFTPDTMSLPTTRGIATSRICAGFGVDPMVLGLQSDQKTYSNYEEANRAAWEHNVLPTQGMIAETLDIQLLPDFDDDENHQVGFNNKNVAALQEKRGDLYQRITLAVGGPWLTPNEGRAEAGLDDMEGGDELTSVTSQQNAVELAKAKPASQPPADRKAIAEAWRELVS